MLRSTSFLSTYLVSKLATKIKHDDADVQDQDNSDDDNKSQTTQSTQSVQTQSMASLIPSPTQFDYDPDGSDNLDQKWSSWL